MNQPKETPKQEQKVDPNKAEKTIPTPAVPKPEPPKTDPVPVPKPQAKQVTISVKGNNGYIMGAKRWMYKMAILCIKYYNVQD